MYSVIQMTTNSDIYSLPLWEGRTYWEVFHIIPLDVTQLQLKYLQLERSQ